ncbi:10718_t:CDS:2 [Diversispora eburnea]|uniref:1,3-beta-glucan synthase n=1 Tax=Diversispora eburnea TaxID=1213867 RepID=A0A9N8UZJ3_9GLOM|nr:10718_t:CDS:2 [Diversispora eburnea]
MGRNELIFYYGYDLSSLTIQQRNLILNAYEEKLKYSNQPQLLPQSSSSSMRNYTDNFTKDFSEDSAIGIKRPDGIHCPLVELLESYENIVKLNEIENEILKIREEKVKNLIRMNIMNIENKKRKIENYSVSTTPTTPIDKFSLEFILNSSPQPVIANPINPKNIKNIKNKYIAPLGLYRDYSGINNPTPYLYFFRFSHFNQNYELDLNLMSQIEMLAKTKEDEILQFFNNLGIINLQQPRCPHFQIPTPRTPRPQQYLNSPYINNPASYFDSHSRDQNRRNSEEEYDSYPMDDISKFYDDSDNERDFVEEPAYPAEALPINSSNYGSGNQSSETVYVAWSSDNHQVPVSKEEIYDIFIDLTNKFGFQKESMNNMYDHLMCMLDSRASRMSPSQALLSLHADFIGGENSNYRKWYFATRMDLDDVDNHTNHKPKNNDDLNGRWNQRMNQMSQYDRLRQIALWLLLWGEAAQIRFIGECLCFLFKLADDYSKSLEFKSKVHPVPEGEYLKHIVTPLYRYIRGQGYEIIGGKFVRKEKDHVDIIGYDDINQLFWHPESIDRIILKDNNSTRLMAFPPSQRYQMLGQVDWKNVFEKTYKEKRTWFHLAVNFTRIWIIHIATFCYYTAYNSPFLYMDPGVSEPAVHYSMVALGGSVATLFMIIGCICEFLFIPLNNENVTMLTKRLIFLFIILIINTAPTYYIYTRARSTSTSLIIALTQLGISFLTTLTFAIVPSANLFGSLNKSSQRYKAIKTFTANYPTLNTTDRAISISLWCCVFGCKLVESYFFMSLSFSSPLKAMYDQRVIGCNDKLAGDMLCYYMPVMSIVIMFIMELVLFFLDTYLWYIIWSAIFSAVRALYLGMSIWTSMKKIYSMLPEKIYSKILAATNMEIKYKPPVLVPQIWNAIVIAMYREHFVSMENVLSEDGQQSLNPPTFFESPNSDYFFPPQSEAERRISFFAQSLSTTIPDPLPIQNMPTFTVLTPHYSEKILLSLREILREEDQNSRVTLLEYLKQLHPIEWDNFVKDSKVVEEKNMTPQTPQLSLSNSNASTIETIKDKKNDDLAFYSVGFKSSAPEYTLRTRIWASLRSQTLYRTISGFMNYSKAIKLLYRVENPEITSNLKNNPEKLEEEMTALARRKFKFLVSMQRYDKFNNEERENAEFLLRAYPDLQIAYLDEVPPENEGEEPKIFSVLIDGHCKILSNGKRKPKFRIQLPGNPILGDGKSDNQNHAIIFYRGEYLQLVDANQDNYLEECLKIRSVLREFEQYEMPTTSPYAPSAESIKKDPVAIVGAREYIFSENYGVLGDVAAGKEQTFGTLSQRIMAKVGARLHYGHPDFLNAIFMITRGGISKAQKGLHLNEDIYAGMSAFNRGGRIKHTEYYQCGKGRDLGFGSILHFTTKIGTGMGEQMLSREYYYLGTQLPLDRFLTFYYAHPGFHVNNIFIMLSVQLFMFGMMFIGAMASTLTLCDFNPDPTAELSPPGCYNLVPVFAWIKRSITSIFLVFFVAFLPLFIQESSEKGFTRSFTRLGKHFMSLSPLFEVFTTQIYANGIMANLNFGGARYIATGRGFATARIPFAILYSRFSGPSIYFGMRILLILLFVSLTMWLPHLIYFWVSVIALVISPFIFNPHQFSFIDFLVDYREFLRWMSRGNSKSHANSWIAYCRVSRTMITGYKRKRLGHPSEKLVSDIPRPNFVVIFASEILSPFILAALCVIAFSFVKGFDPLNPGQPNNGPSAIIRVCSIAVIPILLNSIMLAGLFFISFCLGPIVNGYFNKFGSVIAAIAHTWSVVSLIGAFELLWYIEAWNIPHAILGMIALAAIQRFIFKVLIIIFLSREFKHDETNKAWWTGKWNGRGLGNSKLTQPFREYICKIVEMSLFAADFILGHIILFMLGPVCLIPWIDKLHSTMLFWLRPSKQIRQPIFSQKQKQRRSRIMWTYGFLFLIMFLLFSGLIAGPIFVGVNLKLDVPI